MDCTLKMYAGAPFLGGRGSAHSTRLAVERLMAENPGLVVFLDFTGVTGVSHSYADELLTPLSELFAAEPGKHVVFTNCPETVLETFSLVCSMHGLPTPAYEQVTPPRRITA